MDTEDREVTSGGITRSGGNLFTRHRRDSKERLDRRDLFDRAEKVYKEYVELLTAANQMMNLEKPAPIEWKSVHRYISGTKPVVHMAPLMHSWRASLQGQSYILTRPKRCRHGLRRTELRGNQLMWPFQFCWLCWCPRSFRSDLFLVGPWRQHWAEYRCVDDLRHLVHNCPRRWNYGQAHKKYGVVQQRKTSISLAFKLRLLTKALIRYLAVLVVFLGGNSRS
jgi:hypothetical protein